MIPLDELCARRGSSEDRPRGLRPAGYYEQGDFALDYNSPKCQVKIGCWGPVVNCNVTKRGWMDGLGGCPNVGGICIGCTMPGFPDKFMPFMDEPPGGGVSRAYRNLRPGPSVRLRGITNKTLNKETKWRPQQAGAHHRLQPALAELGREG
jgi:hydrogenase small subunit